MPNSTTHLGGFFIGGNIMGFRTVFVKNGERLRLKLDNLEIQKEGESFIIPLSDIENIILEGDQTVITSRVLAKIASYHIDVIICDQKFMPCGIYLGMGQYHRSAKRTLWQSTWTDFMKKNAWTAIVDQKIKNQIEASRLMNVDEDRITLMEELRENLLFGDDSNREGHVAKVYFNSIYGQGFTREEDIFPNHCMDYGYAIIRAQVARCVVASGLVPAIGVFHKNEYNSFNLVDDLMEPFRPIMDLYILRRISEDKHNFLSYELRLILINFLNQQIKIKGKNLYITQVIMDYVNSFIKAMEKDDLNLLLNIDVNNFIEVD